MKIQLPGIIAGLGVLFLGVPIGALVAARVDRMGQGQGPQMQTDYRIEGPFTHDNLSVFLIHGKDKLSGKFLTLQEALNQKKVVVDETGSVNELRIENVSGEEIYVQSGDIVKGGRQDRMLVVDLIVPAHSGKIPIAAFCVEHGRWSQRGGEAAGVFSTSNDSIATKELKLAAKGEGSQTEVWRQVGAAQARLSENVGATVNSSASPSSFQLAIENKEVQKSADGYIEALSQIVDRKSDVIGYAFAINGKINSADVYASSALFKRLWPKLLKSSAIEAVADFQKDGSFEAPTVDDVRGFLAASEAGSEKDKDVTSRIRLVTRESDENIFFETRDRAKPGVWVHRNYIKKD
jgi:hypothetical protein